jgi:hypothetical protein
MDIPAGNPPRRELRRKMLVYRDENTEIWSIAEDWGVDFYVYGLFDSGDPKVCPSIGMAIEVAASCGSARK